MMTGQEKKLNELRSVLSRGNSLKISQTIRALRNEAPLAGAIGILISYYDGTLNNSIRQTIREFMNDMKNNAFQAEVIDEIRRHYKEDTLEMLVASCWQSGLDYSEHCADFADLFMKGSYMLALECFTVIESSAQGITSENKSAAISMLEEEIAGITDEKRSLALELISVLRT